MGRYRAELFEEGPVDDPQKTNNMLDLKQLPKYLRYTYQAAIEGNIDPEILEAVFDAAIRHRADRDNWPHKPMTDEQLAKQRVLYKYRGIGDQTKQLWSRDWGILEQQTIWLSHPSAFNDPFDAQLLMRFDLMEPKLRDALLKQSILDKEPTAGRNLVLSKMKAMTDSLLDPKQHDQMSRAFMENRLDEMKVLCLGAEKDNILMWSHYAQNHEGFAIGFDAVKLNDLCFKNGGFQTGYVAYRDKYPILRWPEKGNKREMEELIATIMNVKSRIWKYEKEVRVSFFKAHNSIDFSQSPDLVSEIIMGAKMEMPAEQKMLQIVDSKYPNAQVYKAHVSRDAFSLQFTQVR